MTEIKNLILENEALKAENETYFKTCNDLIKTIKSLRTELDELNANIEAEVNKRLSTATIWDLSEEAQEQAGHTLARALLGGK